MKNCAHCGCVNDSVNRYCRNCGARFAEEEAQEQKINTAPPKADSLFEADETGTWERGLPGGEPDRTVKAVKPDEGWPLPDEPASPGFPQHTRPVIDFDFMDQKEPPQEEPDALSPFPARRKGEQIDSVIQTLKKSGASLSTLCFCLFFTVYLGLAIWSAATSLDPHEVGLTIMSYEQSAPDQSVLTGLLIGALLLRFIPGLLTMIGMWLFYGACVNRKRNYVKTSGLGVVFSGAVVQICLLALGVLSFIVGGAALLMQWESGPIKSVGVSVMILVMAVLLLVAAVLSIVYSAKLMGLIRRVRHTSATGEADAKISVFVIVMTLIMAIGEAPVIGYCIAAGDFIKMGGSIAHMLALIFISVGLLHYREGMKNIIYRQEHPLPDKM